MWTRDEENSFSINSNTPGPYCAIIIRENGMTQVFRRNVAAYSGPRSDFYIRPWPQSYEIYFSEANPVLTDADAIAGDASLSGVIRGYRREVLATQRRVATREAQRWEEWFRVSG